ncbi:subtilisin-like protein, partial [Thozetella sp. PMI_491]
FTSELFHGASFDLSGNTVASVADIQALPEVEKVWEAALYTVPVTSSGIGRRDDVQFPSWSPHNQTGVAEAHALGHFGEGSLVAIVDTGVDYNHPALGGGFGPGFKIEAGYDLVGDDYVVGGPYVPDADPNDCAGHGTHVSGIVGSSEPQWLGVAPSARLRMYKVFGCGGSTYEDVIVAGFLQAYEEGPPDVITASLGSNRGFPTTALAMVATQLQAAGVFVNIAAGNAGANGPFFTSSGGNGYGSMAVGSIELSESAPAVINDFSSWGPTTDARMKPEISAPGGDIFSTYLDGGWTVLSGTSMATPYIAGVAALFFESRGGKAGLGADAARIAHETIISSASPVLHSDGTNNTAPMAQQGAGMVNALKVVSYTTSVSPGNINFNDTDHFQGSHEIKIVNSGNGTVTYQLSHAPGITINTKNNRDAWVAVFPPYSSNEGELATVQFSSDTIKLGPGESSVFTATFTEPADADPLMLPVYGGAIKVAGSNGETLSVTYLGSYYQSDMWEMERGTPLFLSGRAVGGLIPEGWNYTFEEGGDYPQPYYNVLWPATELSFDFVDRYWNESDWVYPPVPGQNKFNGSFITQPGGLDDSWLTYPVVGYPRNGAFYAVPRNIFANGEDIPAGEYRILGRALRTYGDPHNLNDWQWKLSPWFNI